MVGSDAVYLEYAQGGGFELVAGQVLDPVVATCRVGMVSAYRVSSLTASELEALSLSTPNGVVRAEDEYILYTPAQVGGGGFVLGDESYIVDVQPGRFEAPEIEFPRDGGVLNYEDVQAYIAQVQSNHPSYLAQSLEWQVGADEAFTNVVLTTSDEALLKHVLLTGLEYGNTYYLRVRVVGEIATLEA